MFSKQHIKLEYTDSNYWDQETKSIMKIVNGRKYKIKRNGKEIQIERKVNDIFDLMGFVPLKRIGIAEGKIKNDGKKTTVNFDIKIKPIFEILFTVSAALFGLIIIFGSLKNLEFGIMLGLFLTLYFSIFFLMFKNGLSHFKSDLENDINYFEK